MSDFEFLPKAYPARCFILADRCVEDESSRYINVSETWGVRFVAKEEATEFSSEQGAEAVCNLLRFKLNSDSLGVFVFLK